MLYQIVLFFFIIITGFSALAILFTKNVLYAAFLFLITLLGISALYAMLGADFLAVAQIVVYVGGVLILLLFGIMLTTPKPLGKENLLLPETRNIWLGFLAGLSFFAILLLVIFKADFANQRWLKLAQNKGNILKNTSLPTLGVNLLTEYILAFEIIAILLLIALIGATLIAGRKTS
jgi:NADH-quinone oxidoreductase subunit J